MRQLLLLAATLVGLGCNLGQAIPQLTDTPAQVLTLSTTPSIAASTSPIPNIGTGSKIGATLQPNVTVQLPPRPGSQRIQFAAGATSATVTGMVAAQGLDGWIIGVKKGQSLSIKLTFTTGEATIGMSGMDGSVVTVDEERATRFSGVMPTTQDYYITIVGNPQTLTNYTLTVTLH